MGMPIEFNTLIVTKGKEVRIDENIFTLEKDGYRVYPMEIPMDVRKTKFGEKSGTAEVQKLQWEDGRTLITYKLTSLHSVN
ncbi:MULTISPECIES: DUF2584 domain-containing protein [Bacillus]|uniref:DUF2584 domain-containing protein n=1 Tax=Bacillus subtilis TaxID=1423 RepID=A0AAP2M4V3_BACIU|nr:MULTISPECIES: DUF2584 domain-containing protein [Bacillus]KIN34185.1 hypothetical protein B4071_3061 [Bacillus subtilis]MBO3766098.1 DUF2584 domain-containing protein [Bacillus subtilis]MBP3046423.1 DUF2584 domain-containing protein [Bacillus subtilis subsp. subtilis]MCB4342296.1 hypothetical protein [Bacillus subtilis]MCG3228784.1 DUF2584 domain-containing protein [Bacillus subtilis]